LFESEQGFLNNAAATERSGGYDPSFYAKLERVEDGHFWFAARRCAVEAVLKRHASDLPEAARVLELGCGGGDVLRVVEQTLPGAFVAGMELNTEGLLRARRRVKGLLVRGDATKPPFKPGFDLVCLFDVLEHLPKDDAALLGVGRLLKPNGRVLLTVPADPSLWSYFDEASHHCRRYELKELETKLKAAGFVPEFMTPYMRATYPLIRLGRTVRGFLGGKRRPAKELTEADLRIIPGLNGLLKFLLKRDAARLKKGRVLSAGSSLLALARKS